MSIVKLAMEIMERNRSNLRITLLILKRKLFPGNLGHHSSCYVDQVLFLLLHGCNRTDVKLNFNVLIRSLIFHGCNIRTMKKLVSWLFSLNNVSNNENNLNAWWDTGNIRILCYIKKTTAIVLPQSLISKHNLLKTE